MIFSAIAERDEKILVLTPYGWMNVERKRGDILQPNLMSRAALEVQNRAITAYNFAAQYQQNPEPPSGNIVKRAWLKLYLPEEKPHRFEMILQAWDTANKDTELANFSVCTTRRFSQEGGVSRSQESRSEIGATPWRKRRFS